MYITHITLHKNISTGCTKNRNNLRAFPGIYQTNYVKHRKWLSNEYTYITIIMYLFKTKRVKVKTMSKLEATEAGIRYDHPSPNLSCAMVLSAARETRDAGFNGLPFLETPQEKRPVLKFLGFLYLSNRYIC